MMSGQKMEAYIAGSRRHPSNAQSPHNMSPQKRERGSDLSSVKMSIAAKSTQEPATARPLTPRRARSRSITQARLATPLMTRLWELRYSKRMLKAPYRKIPRHDHAMPRAPRLGP